MIDLFGEKEAKLKGEVSEAYGEADDAYVLLADAVRDMAKIALTADGWCLNCQDGLFKQLIDRFPQYHDVLKEIHTEAELYHKANREQWEAWRNAPEGTPEPKVWNINLHMEPT